MTLNPTFIIIAFIILIPAKGFTHPNSPSENAFICNIHNTILPADPVLKIDTPQIQYSKKQLMAFLDSIGHMDNSALKAETGRYADSIYNSRKQLDIKLPADDLNTLKQALLNDSTQYLGSWIDLPTAQRIFPFAIDSNAIVNNKVEIALISFDVDSTDFNEFAICIGTLNFLWENDVYFFKNNHIISFHHNYSRFGVDIKHFKDDDGKTVIYYKENFGSGSGIWQYNYFFYKYSDDKLLPVLNILQNGNLNNWGTLREFWLETFITNTHPLTMKFVYSFGLEDSIGMQIPIVNDSALVQFEWKADRNEYTGKFSNKFKADELYTYYLDCSDVLYLNVYYKKLKAILKGNDMSKKQAALSILNQVKNDLNP